MTKRTKAGFTLTELAIVTAIIGGVVGAIWTVAADVNLNKQINVANKQLAAMVGNIRTIYAEQGGITDGGDATPTTVTQSLDRLRAFPLEMRGASGVIGVIYHDWNQVQDPLLPLLGNVDARAANCAAGTGKPLSATSLESCVGITYHNLPQNACAQFATSVITAGTGLQSVIINGNNVVFPVDIGTANSGANCGASPTTNKIEFVYLLKDNAT